MSDPLFAEMRKRILEGTAKADATVVPAERKRLADRPEHKKLGELLASVGLANRGDED